MANHHSNDLPVTAASFARRPYARVLIPADEGGFTATVLEFPGCISEGDTAEEAMANLGEALEAIIETMLELGEPIPEPFEAQEFSGRVTLRIPPSLHAKAVRMAAFEGVSLNRFLSEAIAEAVAPRLPAPFASSEPGAAERRRSKRAS